MRDNGSECKTGREVMPLDGVVVMTLGAKGDFRGRSMLRPTRLLRGILYRFLHETSPETQKEKRILYLQHRKKKEHYTCTTEQFLIIPNEKL